ncbi:hypothetical protein [Pseudonocardia halophobica]|uniref:hypothetical protein n=1 Tax=Pseudonocardia halophobica TaxID=29401 RepID=UPI00056C6C13|nr:hypothetical protein [Pseudonocardia halophobica]
MSGQPVAAPLLVLSWGQSHRFPDGLTVTATAPVERGGGADRRVQLVLTLLNDSSTELSAARVAADNASLTSEPAGAAAEEAATSSTDAAGPLRPGRSKRIVLRAEVSREPVTLVATWRHGVETITITGTLGRAAAPTTSAVRPTTTRTPSTARPTTTRTPPTTRPTTTRVVPNSDRTDIAACDMLENGRVYCEGPGAEETMRRYNGG